MGLTSTPSSERIHIGLFGLRNAGKSSLANAILGQELSLVSEQAGTTTDPVKKAMELAGAGPVLIIDTPGTDDEGELGKLRVSRALHAMRTSDVALLVVDAQKGFSPDDAKLLARLSERCIPVCVVFNKTDAVTPEQRSACMERCPVASIAVSAATGEGIYELKERLVELARQTHQDRTIVGDLVGAAELVVLVVPIDASAPKGRLILPQQLVLRELLDLHAQALVLQPSELSFESALLTEPPALVICDSQALAQVAERVPESVLLTTFSILMARYKGSLEPQLRGAAMLGTLNAQSHVLISEGCTHHRQCEDIGTVKLPQLIRSFCGSEPQFSFTSGADFPDNLEDIDLIVHCGACMLSEREMAYRLARAQEAGVPIVNYGMAFAQMSGLLKRCILPFPDMLEFLT